MDAPIPQKFRVLEARNSREDPLLPPGSEPRLKTNQVPHLRGAIFLPQLDHGVWLTPGASPGINQSNWLHGPKPEGLRSPLRHLLDGQAALEVRDLIELVAVHVLLAGDQLGDERFVLWLRERRVPVVVSPALAVARGLEQTAVVERVGGDDRRDGVEERERFHAEPRRDRSGKGIGGEWTRRDDAGTGKLRDFTPNEGDVPMAQNPSLQALRKRHTIDRECAPTRNPRVVRGLQHNAAKLPHLGFEQAVRVRRFDRFEGVAADELGEALSLMRRRHLDLAQLVQHYTDATLGEGPGGFAAREAAADYEYGRSMLRPYDATSSASGVPSSTTI